MQNQNNESLNNLPGQRVPVQNHQGQRQDFQQQNCYSGFNNDQQVA